MSSTLSTGAPRSRIPHPDSINIAIIKTEWNSNVTTRLTDSAISLLKLEGYNDHNIDTYTVPGAVELTFAASRLIDIGRYDAVIVFGCVIRGDTPHFDYVCQSVTQGVTALNASARIPVIFGVLTVDNLQDALDRCGGRAGDKGAEAAEAALKMCDFSRRVLK